MGTRLYVEDDLAPGRSVPIEPRSAHHLVHVLRLKAGDRVILFNGRDGEFGASLEVSGKSRVVATVAEQVRAQDAKPDLIYAFAPLKQARLDYMIQKAVEMGAGSLQPVVTKYTNAPRLREDKVRAHIREAAEQCGALSLPMLKDPLKFRTFIDEWAPERALVFCDESATISNAVDTLCALRNQPLGILVGPEGGFSPEERSLLRAQEWCVPISLGPRILRADTAAVAALALVQTLAGEWTR